MSHLKNAYMVFGVGESTGCRFISRVLMECGVYGTDEHSQEFDKFKEFEDFFEQTRDKPKILIRKSYPHGNELPSISEQYYKLKACGYFKIYTIITTRSQPAQIVSIESNGHIKSSKISSFLDNPVNRIKLAYKHIFSELADIEDGFYNDFVVINLNDISENPYINLRYILESVDIRIPKDFNYLTTEKHIDKKRYDEFKNKFRY